MKKQEWPQTQKDNEKAEMLEWIEAIDVASEHTYGSRRMQRALNCLGYPVGRQQTRQLMKEANVKVRYKKKYKITTNSDHDKPVFDNVLNREFDVNAPDQAYVCDITYVWTREGWLYLAVIIDLYSRRVIGWCMQSRMQMDLVLSALLMAVWRRKPKSKVVIHSDQGSQFTSLEWQAFLKTHNLEASMSRRGNCYDNAVAESFFHLLKSERIRKKTYATREEARQDVFNYIELFYNPKRKHGKNGMLSPIDFERQKYVKLQSV